MYAMSHCTRRNRWLAALLPIAFVIAGCSSTATAPDNSGSKAAGSGLSGEMRNIVQGKVGGGGVSVQLFLLGGATCNTTVPALQTTMSNPDGSYEFGDPVQPLSYCIKYGSQTFNCPCNWGTETCTCSPPLSP